MTKIFTTRAKALLKSDDGAHKRRAAAAVFVLATVPVLFGFAALAVDLGYLYNVKGTP